MNVLSVRGLCKRYGSFALRDVSFDVAPGSITGFIGRNGAGKTTTLKSLLDFVHPDAGEALFFGRPLSSDEFGVKQAVGFASGGFGFYPLKRLRTVTDVTRRFYPSWDETAYRRYLALFALDENKRVKELSEGMKVKYALALALSHRARLLVLDEPTSGLDPVVRSEMLDLFLEFIQDEEHSILLSSHITSDLEKIADYITYIHQGRVVLSDSKDAILEHYAKLGCTQAQLRDIQPGDLVRVRKGSFGCEALVRDRAAFARKYPGLMLDRVTLEDIMLLIGKGESA